jgi:hypothetical protein
MNDIFRPRHQPAQMLYDAFQAEAHLRETRPHEQWRDAEVVAVWRAARDYAQMYGLPVPTLAEVQAAERSAAGHTDYATKWAYGVARLLTTTVYLDR